MKIEIYVATVQHDKGKTKFRVVSLSGKEGAIEQVKTLENCPESAIIAVTKIGYKKIVQASATQ
ncbi:hypothetical protein [Chryseobacterium aureum]|uniref:hypothetical protein n=1 Tax=Chryseobacterium aureum TaxID=2497456 RepID=UPI000F89108A|nr:hypothetical protein [Chryseobacterium aureum]